MSFDFLACSIVYLIKNESPVITGGLKFDIRSDFLILDDGKSLNKFKQIEGNLIFLNKNDITHSIFSMLQR